MDSDVPEDLQVNAKVSVNKGVAEPGNSFFSLCWENGVSDHYRCFLPLLQ
jgi:hypothetical protein